MADKIYASGNAHRKSITLGVNKQGFQQLEDPLMKRSR